VRVVLLVCAAFAIARADVEVPPAALPGESAVSDEEYDAIAAAIDASPGVTEKPRPLAPSAEEFRWHGPPPSGRDLGEALRDAWRKPRAPLDQARVHSKTPLRTPAAGENAWVVSRVGFSDARRSAVVAICFGLGGPSCVERRVLMLEKRPSGWAVVRKVKRSD